MKAFEIQLPSEMGKSPYYYEMPDVFREDIDNLRYAVLNFSEWYGSIENQWQVVIHDDIYRHYVRDIKLMWDFIPYHLQEVVAATPSAMIDIYEQSIEFYVEVEPADEGNVMVSIILGEEDYRRNEWFKPSPKPAQSPIVQVKREDYIREWWKFVRWMVDLLITHQWIAPDDPSLRAYLDKMPPASETKSS
ncbi:MAG: hypothetical protein K8L99_25735 [Anaerolineae bacterium]|nr:hypothetical protein [Anaerolineae bacterium]